MSVVVSVCVCLCVCVCATVRVCMDYHMMTYILSALWGKNQPCVI